MRGEHVGGAAIPDAESCIQCNLLTPADVTNTFNPSPGFGQFHISLSKSDSCEEPTNGNAVPPEHFAGKTIGFNMYQNGSSAKIVSTASNMVDSIGLVIPIVNMTGSLILLLHNIAARSSTRYRTHKIKAVPRRKESDSQTGLPFSRVPRRERTLEVHCDNCQARFVAWYGRGRRRD
jgi:hypothetical protein